MMDILESPKFWAVFIPAMVAVLTLYIIKAQQIESEWRKEKLRLYLEFIEALSGITDFEKSINNDIKFAKACNDLHALASEEVLEKLHAYQSEIAMSNTRSTPDDKQEALNRLVLKMRKDLKVRPKDKNFKILLWTSGRGNK